jgi:hypothetical protein
MRSWDRGLVSQSGTHCAFDTAGDRIMTLPKLSAKKRHARNRLRPSGRGHPQVARRLRAMHKSARDREQEVMELNSKQPVRDVSMFLHPSAADNVRWMNGK